ncbi:MAG: porin [Candidatus Solibacter sp.]
MTPARSTSFALCVALTAAVGWSQTTPAASPAPPATQTPAATAAPADPPYVLGPVTFSGLVDLYYNVNFNHPASGFNQLRNFDQKANQFSLNLVKLTAEHTPDPLGFRIDLGFGRSFDTIHATEQAPSIFRYLEQAYVSVKPKNAGGLQLDFGEFVTPAGAEVIETNGNWNYSRSLLFAWGIPYYHFGARATMPVGKHFNGGVSLVNGWNNIEDNNTGKTVIMSGNFTSSKATWSNNYIVGPEKSATNEGKRQLYDTTLLLTPHPKASMYVNFDYGQEHNIGKGAQHWVGIAGAARFQATSIFALAPRVEWFNDANGFSTGTQQKVKEFTMTGEFKTGDAFLTRIEYRRDWSDVAFFERGSGGLHKSQSTLLVGLVAYFGPKK